MTYPNAISSSLVWLVISFIGGSLGLLFALILTKNVLRSKEGNDAMKKISEAIRQGASAYLNRQYKTVAVITAVLAVLIAVFFGIEMAVTFILGAALSAFAGYVGMMVSVRANVRTAEAANKGLKDAFKVAFQGGAVTGFAVAGLGLTGVVLLYALFHDPEILIGFGFGASLISLFARVGGGIYTKGADVGADLVGKVEKDIPEDDPRNPAVIADNVGDNVGDCAGMAADLFESYTVTIIAAMLLAWVTMGPSATAEILFPLVLVSVALIASVIGSFFVKTDSPKKIWSALNKGILISAGLAVLGFFIINHLMFDDYRYFVASILGIGVTLVIGWVTEYYTSAEKKPVAQIADSAKTGSATTIIMGMAKGMESVLIPVLAIVIAALGAYVFGGGFYGVAIAATAMLSMTAIVVAVDAYGPITDNAGGIAEMSKMPAKVRETTDVLDAVGNTTKAVTKGFAIGSAGLAALSLFAAYKDLTLIEDISIYNPYVVAGLFIGGLLPFIFSSLTMMAVGRAAFQMVEEVRDQFKRIPGLMKGTNPPDYAKCVDISTKAAMKELILPGIIAVLAPLITGFVLGPEALAGLLAGSILTGLLLAITMTTSGAAWDNAKKYVESGKLGGKGSDAHKAAVVGDTVGDPFKDTSGPALNPLIKVLNTIALLVAPLLASWLGLLPGLFP